MCRAPIFPQLAGDLTNLEPRLKRLVTFLGAGFRAAATGSKEK
jgi:hypothetical protein